VALHPKAQGLWTKTQRNKKKTRGSERQIAGMEKFIPFIERCKIRSQRVQSSPMGL